MEVGLRVVRGPNWKWQNQDGGEGHVGTVVEIGRTGNGNTPEKTVVVQWDCGFRTNYRVGYQGEYDLLVFDRSPVGVRHPDVVCDSCRQKGIMGTRWKCSTCADYDLCQSCYMGGQHELSHIFYRIDIPGMTTGSVKVMKRLNAAQLEAKGIFPGAVVIRGPDWDWGNQDGGPGKNGRVTEIRGWDDESGQSVANVVWESGSANVYRLGHKGKVDLKYIVAASSGLYYPDHLAKLGESVVNSSASHPIYKVGDKVRVDLTVDVLRVMQEGHGGWNPKMAECIRKIGVVHRITDRGDIRVQYGDGSDGNAGQRWTFHSGALTKFHQFEVGDYVKIHDDVSLVKQLQKGHGDWTENTKMALGKFGRVVKVYPGGDVRVTIGSRLFTFNASCCTLVPNGRDDLNNILEGGNDREEQHVYGMQNVLQELLGTVELSSGGDGASTPSAQPDSPDRLIREAAQGHVTAVHEFITNHPQLVNSRSSGKTALQVACHQGHLNVVQLLIDANADLEVKDDDGDTALHYSAFGDQPEIMKILLKKDANVNALNNGGCTALHVAVNKQHERCVELLLQQSCDVNVQDVYGDTALHDAVGKDSQMIVQLLIDYKDVNFALQNKRGFNVLHHAALKGNAHAAELILKKSRFIVDLQKDDGFAALHLSSLNGHLGTTSVLINQGAANINIHNSRHQTALLLAMSQGHASIVEFLVSHGADMNVKDVDGHTCVHWALLRSTPPGQLDDAPSIQKIHSEMKAAELRPPSLSLACYLVSQGLNVDLSILHDNLLCFQILKDNPQIQQVLNKYRRPRPLEDAGECLVCCESSANILFIPCQHQIVCVQCSSRMKKCLQCHSHISQKIGPDGDEVLIQNVDILEAKRLHELQQKLEKYEESRTCQICMENKWDVAFLCGHSACSKCAESLKVCHMCRKPIDNKINLFT